MSRASFQTLSLALLTSCFAFACSSEPAPTSSTASVQIQPEHSAPTPDVEPAAAPSKPEIVAPESEEPILASTAPTIAAESKPQPQPQPQPVSGLGSPDKAPIAGVGSSGIHLDVLEVGKGWASSRCEDLGTEFDAASDSRVNVCFRVVHPRVDETVTVEWARDGKVKQSIAVNIKPTHAYRTRAWLPVSAGRAGDWTATVKSEDGSVLGQVGFRIVD